MTGTHQQSNDPMVSDHRLTRRELFPLVGAAAVVVALAPRRWRARKAERRLITKSPRRREGSSTSEPTPHRTRRPEA